MYSQARLLVASITAIGVALAALPASAQDDDAALAVEEIVVSARKVEENVQDVPLSIDVFTEAFIEESGSLSIFDLAQFTPNLSFRQSYGRTFDRPSIRGQSVILGANTVGLFVDGVFVQGSISSTPLDNIERIEVIKGPQAALFGRATLSGAINYITKRPGNDWDTKIVLRGAEHDEYEARAYVSGPIIRDTLAFDLGVRHYEYGGEWDNTGPGGTTIGQEQTQSVYGSLYWTPTENFDALLKLAVMEDDDGHPPNFLSVESSDLNCFLSSPRGYYCGIVPAPEDVEIDIVDGNNYGTSKETQRASLELNWDVGDTTLTSQTAYSKEDEDWLLDLGPEANDFFLFAESTSPINSVLDYWSQEIRWASAADQRLRWLVGAYMYESEELDPVDLITDEVENVAVFGSIGYDFNDSWTGTVELRWSEDDITDRNSAGLVLNETFDSVTPRVTLAWNQREGVNYYGSISQGTKPGGFNAGVLGTDVPPAEQARLANFVTYDEEEAWNYELGTKRTVLDGRAIFNAAVFFIDWEEQQLTSAEPFTDAMGQPDTTTLITNIGKTEIFGVELSFAANLNENWGLNIAYGYTDAEIKEQCDVEYGGFVGADPENCDQVRFPGGASVSGNKTPNSPEHNGSATLNYQVPVGFGDDVEFFSRLDFTYESSRYAQVYNLAETGVNQRVNWRLGYRNDNWNASLWVKNLMDDDETNSVIRIIDFDTLFFGTRRAFQANLPKRRQFGVTFEYNF